MLKKFATLLCDYSLKLMPGELFIIRSPIGGIPLAREVYLEAVSRRCHPFIRILDEEMESRFIDSGDDRQLDFPSPYADFESRKANAILTIWANQNSSYLGGVSAERISKARKAERKTRERFFRRMARGELRWCGTLFPTQAAAQDAGLSQELLLHRLSKAKILKLHGKGTDFTLDVSGRKWVSAIGLENMPDGEVFTSPHENSAQGVIHFQYPSRYNGQLVGDICLEFKDGKVTRAVASQNQSFLEKMLDTDFGARKLGEIAIGTNFGIDRFTGETLFDEKIGGTVHAALGAGFEETGGKNKSVIHWDLIHSLKSGGSLEADGKPIIVDGHFVQQV
ncbi:aminopeptidase [bacterium]|nr:aminopeptidase [bacterium]